MTTERIDSLESFDVNGATQWVLLRGDPRSRRVLLIVQMGPGLPLIHEARALERRLHLESDFVVAYWDQRGTGKSWGADPTTINLRQLVADVRAMVDALCARLQVDRLDILGFSLGATLATLAAAQNPARIGHIVAVGIDVDFAESEGYAYAFASDEAARRGDRRAQRQLQAIGLRAYDGSPRMAASIGVGGSSDCSGRTCGGSWHRRTTRSSKRCRLCVPSSGRRGGCSLTSSTSTSGRSSHASRSQSCFSKDDTTSRLRPNWWHDMSTRSTLPAASHSCGSKPAPTCRTTKSPRASARLCSARSMSSPHDSRLMSGDAPTLNRRVAAAARSLQLDAAA